MIEGLWSVRFLGVGDPSMDLNGGVVVLETSRILGGDSGYYYVGSLGDRGPAGWPLSLSVRRHDPTIISIFGDVDTIELTGTLSTNDQDTTGRSRLLVVLNEVTVGHQVSALLTHVADLP